MNVHSTVPTAAYDPHYDPLVSDGPGHNRDYAPTYWIATAGTPPQSDGPILRDKDTDVAIVGSGYTGLACAIFLAREFGIKATVLEANRVAWGCSTRNGGQAQNASGRLSRSQWIERWGVDVARRMHAEITDGFETFEDLVRSSPVDCEPQRGGHLYIAHRQRSLEKIAAESRILNDVFGYSTRVVSRAELRARFRRRGGSRRRRSRAARHRRSSGEARLRLSDHGSQARRQRASGKPGAADRTARRRVFAAHTGRHGEGTRGRHRDRCIHLAGIDAPVARPMHADPVQFARYPSADGG